VKLALEGWESSGSRAQGLVRTREPGLEENCVERNRSGTHHQEHQTDDGEIERVLGARRFVGDQVSGTAMSDDAGDRHCDDQHEGGRSGRQPERQEDSAREFRNHGHAGRNGGHRHAEVPEPLREAIHRPIPDDSQLSERMDHETESDGHTSEEQGEIDEERVGPIEGEAEVHGWLPFGVRPV